MYYQFILGYSPKWNLFKISNNSIQISMHRYRFNEIHSSRWFSFSLMESINLKTITINFSWNKLFTQKWERNTIAISAKVKLIKNLFFQPASIIYFTPKLNYTNSLFLNFIL